MLKIRFVTQIRGFFKHLFSSSELNAEFIYSQKSMYEVNSKKSLMLKKIARSQLFDFLGIIKVVKPQIDDCDVYASFNRFVKSNKPYFIYVENPTALYHYKLRRGRSFLGSKHLNEYMADSHLRALVCMSQACYSTFEKVCAKVPDRCNLTQIYPLVPENKIVNEEYVKQRLNSRQLKLLFIAQGNRFLSKGAYEVLKAFNRLKEHNVDITLTMVTSFFDVDKKALNKVRNTNGVTLYDFKFSYDEMQELYASHHMLVVPTSDDSFNLTVLEAMKAGLPVVGSRLYAIPEMVHDGENGYLCDPAWWFFDENNIPNPKVWNHRKKTIISGVVNQRVVDFLYEKINLLYSDRSLLTKMSLDSLNKANSAPFSREYIIGQWNALLGKLCEMNA